MFVKKYGDLCVGIFFLVVSLTMIIAAKRLPKSAIMAIGPDFLPTIIGVITMILAIILIVMSVKGMKENIARAEAEGAESCDYKRVVESLILMAIYVFIFKSIGFLVSTLIYLPLQIIVLSPNSERTAKGIIKEVVVSVIFTFVVYFLFRYGFSIVLPDGIFAI